MSLINQALRKAQQDRTPDKIPSDPGQPMTAGGNHSHQSPDSWMKPGLTVGLIIMVALLIGIITGLSVVLLKDKGTLVVASPEPEPPVIRDAIRPSLDAQTRSIPRSPESESTPDVLAELRIAREAAEAQAAKDAAAALEDNRIATAAAEEAARVLAAKPSQDAINWLSQSKVTGTRISQSGNKVILNGKAFLVGETVHSGLGLKVVKIKEKSIIFTDKTGNNYRKRI